MREGEVVGLVPAGPQEVVTSRAERLLASGHWLLSAAPLRPHAKVEWRENGAAWLRPGALFAAVVIRAFVVHAAIGLDSPEACAAPLADALEGGPMFYDAEGSAGRARTRRCSRPGWRSWRRCRAQWRTRSAACSWSPHPTSSNALRLARGG